MKESQKHYLGHLAEVSKNNKVTSVEDIFNHRGVLVVKKGTEVDKKLAQKIVKHKLLRPLDESISLASYLNKKSSFEFFTRHLASLELSDIVRQSGIFHEASEAFHLLIQYPLITQKLTVLSIRMPEVFGRSLLTSVMAVRLCKELKLTKQRTEQVFIANAMSDIGLLHIDPQIVQKQGKYTKSEWEMMQGHVIIAKHFADMVPSLPKLVGKALLEHHERPDGFGYPFGKQDSELGIEGQILAMVDKVGAIYRKLVKNGPHSWAAVLAVMQVPSTAHPVAVQKAMLRILKGATLKYDSAFNEIQIRQLVDNCLEKRERLNSWFQEFARIYVVHKTLTTDTENFKPMALLDQLKFTVIQSGVLSKTQHTWLTSLPTNLLEADFLDIEEFALVLDEIEYQCFFVMRQLYNAKDEMALRFNGSRLPILYYQSLMSILDPDEKQLFDS